MTERYTRIAIVFHWLLALAIFGSLGVGLTMTELPNGVQKLKLYNWHKWAGVTILLLSAARLLWRLAHRPPPEPPMPAWQAGAAKLVHGALYVAFFAVPLAGWAYSSSAGFPVVLYGVLPLPDFVAPDKELAQTLKGAHRALAYALGVLVVVHIAGALKHQWIDRDRLIARMWP